MPSLVTLLHLTRPLGFLDTGHSMLGQGASPRLMSIISRENYEYYSCSYHYFGFSTHTHGTDKNGTLGFCQFLGPGCINIKIFVAFIERRSRKLVHRYFLPTATLSYIITVITINSCISPGVHLPLSPQIWFSGQS